MRVRVFLPRGCFGLLPLDVVEDRGLAGDDPFLSGGRDGPCSRCFELRCRLELGRILGARRDLGRVVPPVAVSWGSKGASWGWDNAYGFEACADPVEHRGQKENLLRHFLVRCVEGAARVESLEPRGREEGRLRPWIVGCLGVGEGEFSGGLGPGGAELHWRLARRRGLLPRKALVA